MPPLNFSLEENFKLACKITINSSLYRSSVEIYFHFTEVDSSVFSRQGVQIKISWKNYFIWVPRKWHYILSESFYKILMRALFLSLQILQKKVILIAQAALTLCYTMFLVYAVSIYAVLHLCGSWKWSMFLLYAAVFSHYAVFGQNHST